MTTTGSSHDSVTLAGDSSLGSEHAGLLVRGDVVGRYLVLERLGAGAMGTVYAAHDPELDRKIALKLLHEHESNVERGSAGHRKLLREAQAIARLSHPSVVTVHEVGVHDGRVYMAMELVDGVTLEAWLSHARRPLREILAVFVQAGEGLACAHAAGIVHRDFKPENVLVGRDGRVRVMDFGLARAARDETDTEVQRARELVTVGLGASEGTATRSDGIAGTPAYMAPEQHLGTGSDARSDQFAFCVALHRAVYGERPFAGTTLPELTHAVISGKVRPERRGAKVPSWLREVILRGLATEPSERWPSMDALLRELARRPARRRRLAVGAAMVAAIGAVGAAGVALGRSEPGPDCDAGAQRLTGVWDESRRAEVERAFAAIDRPYARRSTELVIRGLDDIAAAWVAEHREACVATHVRREQSPARLDLRMACLGRSLRDVGALVGVLARADTEVLDRAVDAVHALPRPHDCARASERDASPADPTDPEAAARVASLREDLARSKALARTGKYDDSLALATAVREGGREVDHPPLVAEAGLQVGELELRLAQAERALASLEDAYFAARSVEHEQVAVDSALMLAYLDAAERARPDDAQRWIRQARVEIGDDPPPEVESRIEHVHAIALSAAGKPEIALEHLDRAMELIVLVDGPDGLEHARALGEIALELDTLRRLEPALEHVRKSLEIQLGILGPDHPDVASTINDLANIYEHMGRFDDAVTEHRRALAIRTAALGEDHPHVAQSFGNLGLALTELERHDEAIAMQLRALEIYERRFGSDGHEVARAVNNLAHALSVAGRHEQALGPYARALELHVRKLGEDHPQCAYPLFGLARAELALEHPERARPHAERAQVLCKTGALHDTLCASIDMMLARALWPTVSERARARALALSARDVFATKRATHGEELTKAEAWLAEHAAP